VLFLKPACKSEIHGACQIAGAVLSYAMAKVDTSSAKSRPPNHDDNLSAKYLSAKLLNPGLGQKDVWQKNANLHF
jgi:hypothetical protein